jgi:RNA polymerase sigma-70 factor, ECF subfamily
MEPGSGRRMTDCDDDGGKALHERLIRGDATAPSDLATQYLQPLVDWLHRSYPREDEALLETVAIDLILKVGQEPKQYDPDRGTLSAYLRMAARRDVKNALKSERRRAARQIPLEDVELRSPARNRAWASTSDPADAVIGALDRERLLALREQFGAQDWEVVLLRIEGERRTERYAAVLGLQDRPRIEQEREVKRVKDRVMKRLRRLWRTRYGDG